MHRHVITVYRILSDTLSKMDGSSVKDAPTLTTPALPLKRKQGVKTLLLGSTPETHLETSLSKGSPVRKGGEKDTCSL